MSLTTGSQLKAARALAGIGQVELSKLSGVHANTIRKMEGRGDATLTSGLETINKIQAVLETAGVEFIPENGGGVGVRLRKASQ